MSTAVAKNTFYSAAVCPFCQRAAIAFTEVGIPYEKVEIDLFDKPAWYKDVNPDMKVPSLATQGKNIAESLVLIEWANDLKPEAGLMPKDPMQRAQVRFVIEFFGSKVGPAFQKALGNITKEGLEEYHETLNQAYTRLNELLLEQSPTGPYFLGSEFSLADVAIAPIRARQLACQRAFLSNFEADVYKQSPRLQEFFEGLLDRPSFKKTYAGDDYIVGFYGKRMNLTRTDV